MHRVFFDAHRLYPPPHFITPILKPFLPLTLINKIFKLHKVKLADAEKKISRRNFVSKCFATLCNTKRQFGMESVDNIFKIDEHPLRYFSAKISARGADRAPQVNRKKQVKHLLLAKFAFALWAMPAFYLVGTKAVFTLCTLNHRVGEPFKVPARRPYRLWHNNTGVEPIHVVARADKLPPPQIFNIFFKRNSKRPVVPRAGEPAINLGALKDKPPAFRERNNFLH